MKSVNNNFATNVEMDLNVESLVGDRLSEQFCTALVGDEYHQQEEQNESITAFDHVDVTSDQYSIGVVRTISNCKSHRGCYHCAKVSIRDNECDKRLSPSCR